MDRPIARKEIAGMMVELWPSAGYEVDAASPAATLGFAFETQHGMDAIDTGRRRPFTRRANSLAWVPPGCPVYSRSEHGGEYLAIHAADPEDIGGGDIGRRAVTNVVDAGAVAAAGRLRRDLLSGNASPDEAAIDALCAGLARRLAEGSMPGSRWLTDARLVAVDRHLDRHLHERVAVADLAAELGLSVGFLVRAFRDGLGTTPHRYLMARRLARARALLASGHAIAATALDCGFADQAHLTRHMRAGIGQTPAQAQRGAR